MKICFIVRGLSKGGVYRFIKNILFELNKIKKLEDTFYIVSNEEELKDRYKNIKTIYIKQKNKLIFDYISSYKAIKKNNFDVLIYPKNVIPLDHFLLKGKKINVIHDLAYFEKNLNAYPFLDTVFMKTFIGISCKKSDKVLAVSNSTKKDIMKRFKIPESKIKVIYEGVESTFKVIKNKNVLKETLKKYNIQKPFLFYSGSVTPRKNLKRVVEAFKIIQKNFDLDLVITGGVNWKSKEEFKLINQNKRIKMLGHIPEKELVHLYNSAEIYLYPSLYEGFGLPILEAQACGCPVITSNITSMPEVAGRGALLINPYNADEIANAIRKIMTNKKFKKNLVQEGFKNVKNFSWKKCAKGVLEVCNEI